MTPALVFSTLQSVSDDFLTFAEETKVSSHQTVPPWKILIADDEQAVHLVTKLALGDFTFEGRPLELLSAYGEDDARRLMHDHPDVALLLLDVVMDTINSGFDLVRYIRNDLKNKDVRIIMRTGQSGNAPEDRVIINYDINDFKDKTELTVAKLRTTMISSLRAYSHLKIIAEEQKKLAASKAYLRNIINSLSSVVITVNRRYEVLLWNAEAERWTGVKVDEAMGRVLWSVTSLFDPFKGLMKEILRTKKGVNRASVPLQKGHQAYVHLAVHPLEADGETELILRLDDVTDSKKKEEQLTRSQKINSLNALSAGFAAELNNVMEDLRSEAMKLPEGSSTEKIRLQSLKATEILKRIVHLTQREDGVKIPIHLDQLLQRHVDSLQLPAFIKVGIQNAAGAVVIGSGNDLEQVLQHLTSNAVDAMTWMQGSNTPKDSKRLDFLLEKVVFSGDYRSRHPEINDTPYWKIQVSDSGIGMSPEVASRIFDPYFTTKPQERGMGLGLSFVYNVVELHGGFIEVASDLGKGTVVQLFLPEEGPASNFDVRSDSDEKISSLQGSGVILVCDDEPMMRQIAGNILKRFGYRVLQAGDGISAIDLYGRHQSEVSLVILDMLLPGMTGLEIFREMKKIRPDVRVLLSSGFGRGENVEQALEEGVAGFLQKPYGVEKLGTAVRDLLVGKT